MSALDHSKKTTDLTVFLFWGVLVTFAVTGCGGSSVETSSPSPDSGDTAIHSATNAGLSAEPGSANADAAVDFDPEARQLAKQIRQLAGVYQQSANAQNLQALSNDANAISDRIDEIASRLMQAPVPDENAARQLKAGAVSELEEAIRFSSGVQDQVMSTTVLNSVSVGHLMSALSAARRARTHMLAAISPETVATETGKDKISIGLDVTGGGLAGFAGSPETVVPGDAQPAAATKAPNRSDAGASTAVDRWASVLDPPVGEYLLSEGKSLSIKVPGLTAQGAGSVSNEAVAMQLRAEQTAQAGIVYSKAPGSYVRVGSNAAANNISEIWNYVENRRIGRIRGLGLGDSTVFALSADGSYFAAQPGHEGLLGIWDVAQAKPLGTIPVTDWAGIAFVAFGAENRLVILDDGQLKIFTMPDGQPAHVVEIGGAFTKAEQVALSPGGKYVSIAEHVSFKDQIVFTNVLTGQRDSVLTLPDEVDRPEAMAFSPNGDRLVLLTTGNHLEVSTFDTKSGRLISRVEVSIPASQFTQISVKEYTGPHIQVFPDGKRFLLKGALVINASTGTILQTLPEQVSYPVGIVGANTLAVLNADKLVTWQMP